MTLAELRAVLERFSDLPGETEIGVWSPDGGRFQSWLESGIRFIEDFALAESKKTLWLVTNDSKEGLRRIAPPAERYFALDSGAEAIAATPIPGFVDEPE